MSTTGIAFSPANSNYLIDVNALIALGLQTHIFHHRVVTWLQNTALASLLTCSITELGFVRIMARTQHKVMDVYAARILLAKIKSNPALPFQFIADDQDASQLPVWVRSHGQTTDGHLLQLAQAHGALLATLDARIPDAFLIP